MINRIRNGVRDFGGNQSGAVLLLSLAAMLIIMMLSWVIIDAGQGARDKVEMQAQADTAAYSQASVKARSMNMIAYANVAKRSIIGIQSMYMGMYYGYAMWIAWRWSKCKWYRPDICIDAAINSAMMLVETFGDFRQLTGSIFLGLFGSGGAAKNYHRRDLQAIDNYQQYMMWLSPWWGYTEATVRGMRNGATTVASFPPPPGQLRGPIPDIMAQLRGTAVANGLGGLFTTAGVVDRLPWKRAPYGNPAWPFSSNWNLASDGMIGDAAYMVEHLANSLHHKRRSSMGAATWRAYGYGMAAFPFGYWWTTSKMGDVGKVYVVPKYKNQASYLTDTSNLTLAYGNRPERFTGERQKYMFMDKEYNHQFGLADDFGYTASGDWSMARSEISYQDGGTPNPFRPSWTARMRPVALPGEWQEAGYDLNQAYHDTLGFLALSSLVGMGSTAGLTSAMKDMVNMERATRSFGHSTIEGITK